MPCMVYNTVTGNERRAMQYRFRKNRRAAEATMHQQLEKVVEEAHEAVISYNDMEGDARIAEELLDCIWACEGALRKLSKRAVDDACWIVDEKARKRGDV